MVDKNCFDQVLDPPIKVNPKIWDKLLKEQEEDNKEAQKVMGNLGKVGPGV